MVFIHFSSLLTLNTSLGCYLGNRCTTYESGIIRWSPYNGILGFGLGDAPIISQLSSRGLAPNIFSHCLRRDGNGGGVLALGEIIDPRMVYTPLVLAVTSHDRGTLVDSGTVLTYLVEEAYDAFVHAIGITTWEMAFQKAHGGYTVFGDVILKDKIIVYDLARRRLGWAKHDCKILYPHKLTSLECCLGNRCTTYESGIIRWSPYNGILRFGRGDAPIISQLSSRGLAPNIFSHCLRRDGNGGGILALGEIIDPRMVYTPLVLAV
ncbi:hypothetical protein DVH24_023229 [Malus domestica]|uniref:Xylanase inhibitor N-terminal domain-containing protein n=1 Tax=Malus domestica TaxID=3750 RepID=A0A498KTN7_MALDO|nr:hypothetical protein DVH24_023229 [Malus domestica]